MRFTARCSILIVFLGLAAALPAAARPFTAGDLVGLDRISDPQVSADGRWVAFVVRSTDLEADRGTTDLWLVDALGEAAPRRLTTDPAGDWNPRWSKSGEHLYFLSTRSGSSQVWRLPLAGGEAQPVTELELDVANLVVGPAHLAVSIEVFVDCGDDPEGVLACTRRRLDERAASKRSGQLYDRLFVRHWDTWKDGRRSHLFVVPLAGGAAVDVSVGLDADVPSKPFGGPEEIAFAPPRKAPAKVAEIVFTARDAGREEPWSTDFNLFAAPLDGSAPPRRLTDNPAWDTHPVFSPDGSTLAYTAMERPGYEADRFRLVLRDWPAGGERVLAAPWDRSVSDFFFSADGATIYAVAQDTGEVPLFAIDVATGRVSKLVAGGRVRSPALAGERVVYGLDHLGSPVELFSAPLAGRGPTRQLTHVNEQRLAGVELGEYEQFSFAGAGGDTVYGWIVEPVGREAGRTYPVAFLIHGGPQGSWLDQFHYRWNPQVYAGAGYAAVLIDFHGSTGYGQAFTDAIGDDWGGKPLEDLRRGLAAAQKLHPWLDTERACALGASYGGYMINWIAGNWSDGFRCLVNHDGLFDLRSMYYSTEELWFPEWEMRGTPWTNPEAYARHNPADHVEKWKTPMLVVHGQLDYRVGLSQGLQTFTALQRRGVPSELLYFPDENHWVLKPNNSLQWHEHVLAWLERWLSSED